MNNPLTNNIIADLKKGSHNAYESIFMTYFPKVKYYINGFIKSTDIADELTQGVFLKIWENRRSLEISAKAFNSYVFIIAYRQTIDYIQKKQVRDSSYNDQVIQQADTTYTVVEYIAEETKLLVETEIENIPEKRRNIFKIRK